MSQNKKNRSRICRNKMKKRQPGFTLIEIAVVLVIVGILLGSFIGSLTQRIETTQRHNTQQQLEDIRIALFGFASAKGRLPCPAVATSNGEESPDGGGVCIQAHGFVPGKTLGIDSAYNQDNLLIDVWGNPVRYSVTTASTNAFTSADGMKNASMGVLDPDLIICDGDSDSSSGCTGAGSPLELIDSAPFVILSLGKDGGTNPAPGIDQLENTDGNRVFVSKSYSSVETNPFDDLIIWVSPYILYSRMMEAGQLP